MNTILEKEKLRKEFIVLRNKIQNKDEKSKIIMSKLISDTDYINSLVIALYKNLDSEVFTNELINYSLEVGKIVVLPRVVGNNLLFYKIDDSTSFIRSSLGVFEPFNDVNKLVSESFIDLVIVPGLCFDLSRNRLGFGKGFYDRVLKNNINNIAICFDEQILNDKEIPTDNHDVKVKKIITDKRII